MPTCVMVLSDKSSGSTLLQRMLVSNEAASHVTWTSHNMHETLFWSKAAALLREDATPFRYSRYLPVSKAVARRDLADLLEHNTGETFDDDESLVVDGWATLCEQFAPVFVEKSPHHLHSRPALSLMVDVRQRLDPITFRWIGLVRHPLDTVYSMWRRWQLPPAATEREWVRAYTNLLWFEELVGDAIQIVRYEDLVADVATVERVFRFAGLEPGDAASLAHQNSLGRPTRDTRFGFRLSHEAAAVATEFGYDVSGGGAATWAWRGEILRTSGRRHLSRLKATRHAACSRRRRCVRSWRTGI